MCILLDQNLIDLCMTLILWLKTRGIIILYKYQIMIDTSVQFSSSDISYVANLCKCYLLCVSS